MNDVYEEIILEIDISESIQKESGVYKIENKVNGKIYIGSTDDLRRRFKQHRTTLTIGKHSNSELQADWIKNEGRNFSFTVLQVTDDYENKKEVEKYYIDKYRETTLIYNVIDPESEWQPDLKVIRSKSLNKKSPHEYKNTQSEVIEYLEHNYQDKMNQLVNYVSKIIFYDKEKLDRWFLNNITDKDIKEDERLKDILAKWYNKSGLGILVQPPLKMALKKYGVKSIPKGEILITKELLSEIGKDMRRTNWKNTTRREYLVKS